MCRCRTVSVHSLALSSSMSKRFHRLLHAPSCRASSAAKSSAAAAASRASCRLSEIARSREVYRATTFSTRRRAALLQLDGELVGDVPRLLDQPPVDAGTTARRAAPGCGRRRATRTCDCRVSTCRSMVSASTSRLAEHLQVPAVEVAVALDARVHHPAVQPGDDLEAARPVLRRELVSRPARCSSFMLTNRRWTTLVRRPVGVLPGQVPGQHPAAHVQLEAVLLDVGRGGRRTTRRRRSGSAAAASSGR